MRTLKLLISSFKQSIYGFLRLTNMEMRLAMVIGKESEQKIQELFNKITQYIMFNGYDKFIKVLDEGIPNEHLEWLEQKDGGRAKQGITPTTEILKREIMPGADS